MIFYSLAMTGISYHIFYQLGKSHNGKSLIELSFDDLPMTEITGTHKQLLILFFSESKLVASKVNRHH